VIGTGSIVAVESFILTNGRNAVLPVGSFGSTASILLFLHLSIYLIPPTKRRLCFATVVAASFAAYPSGELHAQSGDYKSPHPRRVFLGVVLGKAGTK
jgi:hypothetical protein